MNTSPNAGQIACFSTFGIWAALWLSCAYGASRELTASAFGWVVASVFVLAVPMLLYRLYAASVSHAGSASYFWKGTLQRQLLSARHLVVAIVTVFLSIAGSFWMLLQFSTYTKVEWLALVAMIPVYWLVFRQVHHIQSGQLKKRYVLIVRTNLHARWLSVLVVFLLYAVLVCVFFRTQSFSSLSEAVAAVRINVPQHAESASVELALRFITFGDATKAYLAGISPALANVLPLALTLLNGLVILYGAGEAFSCFTVPAVEFRRALGPLTDLDVPPPVPRRRVALNSAAITFLVLFVYVPTFAHIERWSRKPEVAEAIRQVEVAVEQIDGRLYLPGTVEKIESARIETLGKLNVSRAVLEGQVDRAFDRMEGRVDAYLDWYYSLSAEYTRLVKLMTGELENYMAEKMVEHLQSDVAFASVSRALKEAIEAEDRAIQEHKDAIRGILESNQLGDLEQQTRIVKSVLLGDISSIAPHVDAVSFNNRIAVGGGIGVAVGAGVTAKLAGKGVFKQAATAVSKVAISKVSGSAAGAVTGAAVGSAVPVVGTLIGGVIGGLITGVLIDKAVLKLEEVYARDDFRKELIVAIGQARADMKDTLRGSGKRPVTARPG